MHESRREKSEREKKRMTKDEKRRKNEKRRHKEEEKKMSEQRRDKIYYRLISRAFIICNNNYNNIYILFPHLLLSGRGSKKNIKEMANTSLLHIKKRATEKGEGA